MGGVHAGGMSGRVACVAMHGGGHAWQGGMHSGGGMCGRWHAWQEGCEARGAWMARGACMAGETATAADATHPTGMHSWLRLWLLRTLV